MAPEDYPTISFIIPTLNAARILPRCLTSIRSQRYPQENVEILVADGGSADETRRIARRYGARVLGNPDIIHEYGKSRAAGHARGVILIYTDADNVLTHDNWLRDMILPCQEERGVVGLLPQTVPPPDSHPINRYLCRLFTDPFTWFVYGAAADPSGYEHIYTPIRKTPNYALFRFPSGNPPLLGLSQGVGTVAAFRRTGPAFADDITAGLMLLETGTVAYVPSATVYHYHVSGFREFVQKYSRRIRDNLSKRHRGMGLTARLHRYSIGRKVRMALFVPYALSVVFPAADGIRLALRTRDIVMLWHVPATFALGLLLIGEPVRFALRRILKGVG